MTQDTNTNTAAASGAADLSEAQELLVWFAEDEGFSQGTAAPHKWVLRAEQELRRLSDLQPVDAVRIFWQQHTQSNAMTMTMAELHNDAELVIRAIPRQPAAPAAVAGPSEAVAYLDIGAGGYLDLGTDLTDEALSRLPKGRHALVIAGTYGIDGYIAAPTTQPEPQKDVLAAGGDSFLLLPTRPKPDAPANTAGLSWDAYSGAQMLAYGRLCSDAALLVAREGGVA